MPAVLWFAIGASILCAITSVYLERKNNSIAGPAISALYLCRLCLCRMKSMKEHRMEDINGKTVPTPLPKLQKAPQPFCPVLAFLVTLALMMGAVALVPNMTS